MQRIEKAPEGHEEYLLSPEWRALRAIKIAEAGFRCQVCNGEDRLHCHHRTYDTVGTLAEKDDLIVLCGSCHGAVTWRNSHSRAAVRTAVSCPECGAQPGNPCVRRNGTARTANHVSRRRSAGV